MSNERYVPVNIRVGSLVGMSLDDVVYELRKRDPAFKVIPEQLGLSLQRQQIVRVPANRTVDFIRDPEHAVRTYDDIERGFITSIKGDTVYCRYYNPGLLTVRTRANSEGSSFGYVYPFEFTTQDVINRDWKEFVDDFIIR